VFVIGLTVGDYLLWNWSLNGNHDVLALVSGLTLPPLAVACLWLLAMSVARMLARSARIPALRAMRGGRTKIDPEHRQRSAATGLSSDQSSTSNTPPDRPSRKLAA
jgi:hypothetical protein